MTKYHASLRLFFFASACALAACSGDKVVLTPMATASPLPTASPSATPANVTASASGAISPVNGGQVSLPDGSYVAIPGGVFQAPVNATVYEVSSTDTQTANPQYTAAGPAFIVTFASGQGASAAGVRAIPRRAQLSTPTAPTFQFNIPSSFAATASGDLATLRISDSSGDSADIDVDAFDSGGSVRLSLPSAAVSGLSSIELYFNTAGGTSSQPVPFTHPLGVKQLVGSSWSPISGSVNLALPTVIFIHDIFSSVEDAFNPACAQSIASALGDSQVLGVDYDWTQAQGGPGNVGALLAQQLPQLYEFGPVAPVDVVAHGYGSVEFLENGFGTGLTSVQSALPNDNPAAGASWRNLVFLGGPLSGTPFANAATYLTLAMNTKSGLHLLPSTKGFVDNGLGAALNSNSPALQSAIGNDLQASGSPTEEAGPATGSVLLTGGTTNGPDFAFENWPGFAQVVDALLGDSLPVSGTDGIVPVGSALSTNVAVQQSQARYGYASATNSVVEDHVQLECGDGSLPAWLSANTLKIGMPSIPTYTVTFPANTPTYVQSVSFPSGSIVVTTTDTDANGADKTVTTDTLTAVDYGSVTVAAFNGCSLSGFYHCLVNIASASDTGWVEQATIVTQGGMPCTSSSCTTTNYRASYPMYSDSVQDATTQALSIAQWAAGQASAQQAQRRGSARNVR